MQLGIYLLFYLLRMLCFKNQKDYMKLFESINRLKRLKNRNVVGSALVNDTRLDKIMWV